MKRIGIAVTTVALLAAAEAAEACPVCFGDPNSAQTKGAQAGILALLLVTHDNTLASRCARRLSLAAGRLVSDERLAPR